jgi:hypothetical protein
VWCGVVYFIVWPQTATSLFDELHVDPSNLNRLKFKVLEQQYLELLERRELKEALGCLREQVGRCAEHAPACPPALADATAFTGWGPPRARTSSCGWCGMNCKQWSLRGAPLQCLSLPRHMYSPTPTPTHSHPHPPHVSSRSDVPARARRRPSAHALWARDVPLS